MIEKLEELAQLLKTNLSDPEIIVTVRDRELEPRLEVNRLEIKYSGGLIVVRWNNGYGIWKLPMHPIDEYGMTLSFLRKPDESYPNFVDVLMRVCYILKPELGVVMLTTP